MIFELCGTNLVHITWNMAMQVPR